MRKIIKVISYGAASRVLCDDGTFWQIEPEYSGDVENTRWIWKELPKIPQPVEPDVVTATKTRENLGFGISFDPEGGFQPVAYTQEEGGTWLIWHPQMNKNRPLLYNLYAIKFANEWVFDRFVGWRHPDRQTQYHNSNT